MPTTFEAPNYIIGNSSNITASLSSVLTTLDQALQSLQPAPNATTVQFNDTILLTDGITSNTIDNTGYTTKNSVQNSTHFLNFSDNSASGIGPIQKTAGISCNPSTKTLSISNSGNTITLSSQTITQIEPSVGTIPYIPSFVLPAVSNQPIQIPPFNANPHQIIFKSDPIPLIDTLVATTYSIGGEQINCYGVSGGSDMYIGCESGNIYWYDSSVPNWNLIMTMDGSVRCLYFHPSSGRMYIGFKGTQMTSPYSVGGLNHICYSTSFPDLYTSIAVDVWSNYAVNGFDTVVNAVVGDNSYLYFAGEFNQIMFGGLSVPYIAIYDWSSSGFIYAIDNTSGYGFDNIVYGLSLINDKLCATGIFNNVITLSGTTTVNYCVCLSILTGFNVSVIEFLYGIPTVLGNPISILDSVKGDGSTFWISTNDSNINGTGTNYMCQAPWYSFPSVSPIGDNDFTSPQTSYNLQGTIGSVSISNQDYYVFGDLKATFTFQPYIYWNYQYARQEFIDLSSGQIYAFTGSTQNIFNLMGGRIIKYTGIDYPTGWVITPSGTGYGFSSSILWDGSYYIPTSIIAGNPV